MENAHKKRKKQVPRPRGYIRCNHFIDTLCIIVYNVIDQLFTINNSVCVVRRTDRRTVGRTDTTSYRDATAHLKTNKQTNKQIFKYKHTNKLYKQTSNEILE